MKKIPKLKDAPKLPLSNPEYKSTINEMMPLIGKAVGIATEDPSGPGQVLAPYMIGTVIKLLDDGALVDIITHQMTCATPYAVALRNPGDRQHLYVVKYANIKTIETPLNAHDSEMAMVIFVTELPDLNKREPWVMPIDEVNSRTQRIAMGRWLQQMAYSNAQIGLPWLRQIVMIRDVADQAFGCEITCKHKDFDRRDTELIKFTATPFWDDTDPAKNKPAAYMPFTFQLGDLVLRSLTISMSRGPKSNRYAEAFDHVYVQSFRTTGKFTKVWEPEVKALQDNANAVVAASTPAKKKPVKKTKS